MPVNAELLIKEIMKTNVPPKEEGFLCNPLLEKRRKPRKIKSRSEAQTLADFFQECYIKEYGASYQLGVASDNTAMLKIIHYFKNNELEYYNNAKRFIEWCFERKNQIYKETGRFNTNIIIPYLNDFYQDELMPKIENGETIRQEFNVDLVQEIYKLEQTSKAAAIFIQFGIPVAATYYIQCKQAKESSILSGLEKVMCELKKDAKGRKKLGLMLRHSVVGSPYPHDFCLLNWRDIFEDTIDIYRNEQWWRNCDYKGEPLKQYSQFNIQHYTTNVLKS